MRLLTLLLLLMAQLASAASITATVKMIGLVRDKPLELSKVRLRESKMFFAAPARFPFLSWLLNSNS